MDLHEVLRQLAAAPGLPGREDRVQQAARDLLAPYADTMWTDPLGNLVVQKDGSQDLPPVMLATHADEIGFFVSQITDEGFLHIQAIGGIDRRNIMGQQVTVHGRRALHGIIGTVPPHLSKPEDRRQAVPMEDLYVDVGMAAAEVEELVRPGDGVTVYAPLLALAHDRVTAKALDNRAGIAALYVCLHRLQGHRHPAPLLAVLTVQEEVGVRGATTAAYGLTPAVALAVDVGFGDQPGVKKGDEIPLGKGPAIALGPNIHPLVRQRLLSLAQDRFLPHQEEVAPEQTGTDARAIQISRHGIPTGLVSIPLRYMHSPVEVVDLADIRATGELLALFCRAVDQAFLDALQGEAVVGEA